MQSLLQSGNLVFKTDAGTGAKLEAKLEAETQKRLGLTEGATFFKEVLGPYVRRLPGIGVRMLSSLGASEVLSDPDGAAQRHPVFELMR